jgi:hypothetical protein
MGSPYVLLLDGDDAVQHGVGDVDALGVQVHGRHALLSVVAVVVAVAVVVVAVAVVVEQ